VLALTAADARAVFDVLNAFDPLTNMPATTGCSGETARAVSLRRPGARLARVLRRRAQENLFGEAIERLARMGGTPVEVDLAPFLARRRSCTIGPWIAERYASAARVRRCAPEALYPVTREVIAAASRYSGRDAFQAQYRLASLKRATALHLAPDRYARAAHNRDPVYDRGGRKRSDPAERQPRPIRTL